MLNFNTTDLEQILRATTPSPPFPPATDRTAWEDVAAQMGAKRVAKLVTEAAQAAQIPIPPLTATMFLHYKRTGQREGYKEPRQQRRDLLRALVLGECLEGQGRFLDPVLDLAWAICEESTWATSAHQIELTDLAHPVIDINAAMTALELAELHALLGAQLDPLLGKRIYDEVNRRCFTPYLTRHDFKWLYTSAERAANNWTAVCNGGVVGAALYLEPDPARLAALIARAVHSLHDYLATFDQDGGSSEGPGYWDYGFGYYTVLAHLVAQRTAGQIDLLTSPAIRQIAMYPLRTSLSPHVYINFADCKPTVRYTSALLAFLAERLAIPELAALAAQRPGKLRRANLTWALRTLYWTPPQTAPTTFTPSRHDWFRGLMWLIARYDPTDPDALVLAAKGGHNGELHNHNDVGHLIVHVQGESLLADIGRGRYTAAYFGSQRYEQLVNSALGHSVPVVNGQLQQAGSAYAATLLAHQTTDQQDMLHLELKELYPLATGLTTLQRRVTLQRQPPDGWVELVDQAQFAEQPGWLESALITLAAVELTGEAVLIQGQRGALRITFAPEQVTARIEVYPAVDLEDGPITVRRIVFAWRQPLPGGEIRLEITPA